MRDGEREPKINEHSSPITDDMSGVVEQIGWPLNHGNGAWTLFDKQSKLCTIYETRPLCCRAFNCDSELIVIELRNMDHYSK